MIGLGFAVLFDLALGLLCAQTLGTAMHHPVSWFGYGVAMFFALLPDADVLLQSKKEGKVTGTHKNMVHYPFVIIPSVFFLVLVCTGGSLFWATLAGMCVFAHLVHDTMEQSPGIAWLAPIDLTRYRLRIHDGHLAFKMTHRELDFEFKVTMEEWLEREYLKPTLNLFLGIVFFLAMVVYVWRTHPPIF